VSTVWAINNLLCADQSVCLLCDAVSDRWWRAQREAAILFLHPSKHIPRYGYLNP
jgi:hypothetical protein